MEIIGVSHQCLFSAAQSDDDEDDDLPPQDEKLHRLVKEFGSNSWSSVSLHFKVSSFIYISDYKCYVHRTDDILLLRLRNVSVLTRWIKNIK